MAALPPLPADSAVRHRYDARFDAAAVLAGGAAELTAGDGHGVVNADSAAVFAAALTGDRAAGQGPASPLNAPSRCIGGDAGDAAALSRQAALHIDAKAETAAALAGDFAAGDRSCR